MLVSMGLLTLFSCQPKRVTDLTAEVIFPQPQSVVATNSSFELNKSTSVQVVGESADAVHVGEMLAGYLRPATGYALEVKSVTEAPAKNAFVLELEENSTLGDEGYELVIDQQKVTIKAGAAAGLFYGVQTIRQLLPVEIEKAEVSAGPWFLPTGTINDHPEYEYRGGMLDVCRHFFKVEDVKRYIDYLATYKMNRFHFHLTEDQGWRLEIKSWPNLTAIGGKTQVGGGEGGFYTQEQYSDIVKYAQDRFVTVVPEFDMPGHTNAALASYAELNPDNKAKDAYTGIEVGFSTFMTNKEITYKFVTDVLTEIAALTPGEYIHIGGDESHSTKKEDYIYFMNRVQEIVESLGKKAIGWDEFATAAVKPGNLVQCWASVDNAKAAVAQGAKILMSPATNAYIDMKYDSTQVLGLHWAGYLEVDKSYNWNPATHIEGIGRESVIGVEAPLWTETIEKLADIEYMIFPRIIGIAELGWTAPTAETKDVQAYLNRMGKFGKRLKSKGINFYLSPQITWE